MTKKYISAFIALEIVVGSFGSVVFAEVQVMPPRLAKRLKRRMNTDPPAFLSTGTSKNSSLRA